jgi:arylsulfatase A-like enzyme
MVTKLPPDLPPNFHGTIKLDVRESTPDWTPWLPPKAPDGAPNILFVLFDDTGLGAWEPFGGKIVMPTLQKIVANGLIYSQWHTAALCSPTRAMLLTGRNHNLTGNASITEGANGFPGHHARIPDECVTVAQLLQDKGWSTFWVGKNHNVPETDVALGSTKKQWPLAKGFDRFYGFIGGETNQFFPDLIADNHPVEQPYVEGYHLSKDLVDQAIKMIKDQKASNPSKPWFMWLCPGANHAPHQLLKADRDRIFAECGYEGMFNDGYEAYRREVWLKMLAMGVLPKGTQLTGLNPLEDFPKVKNPDDDVLPWNDPKLSDEGRALLSRLMEVYAAFSTYTDQEIGRLVAHLEETGQLDNTLVIWAADNGASGEGSPVGSVNENKFFNGYPDTLADNLAEYDRLVASEEDEGLGGPNSYEHYPTGWAAATSTPFKMFKRYSEYSGGTCAPLVMSWPNRIKVDERARANVRHQYHHCTDIVPTILEACGLLHEFPDVYRGVEQYPLSGVSMCYTWDRPDAPTKKEVQYYAMLGTRGIWHKGWKAACLHAPLSGKGDFESDNWELYKVDSDRSESENVAAHHRAKLDELIALWRVEAHKYWVLPLDDRSATEQTGVIRPSEEPPRDSYTYYPGASPVPESVAVNIRGRSFAIEAEVVLSGNECSGVIFAHGSRFGGHSLFVKDGNLHYVYNFLGIEDKITQLSSPLPSPLALGRETRRIFKVIFALKRLDGETGSAIGDFSLFVDDLRVADAADRFAQVGKFTLCGDGLCVGYDSADAITTYDAVEPTNPFTGGTIKSVTITPSKILPAFSERVLAGAFAAD